jgi:hypothetical protein
MAIITNEGRTYFAQKQAAGQPIEITEFVFCNIPGVNSSTPELETQTLPPLEQQVHTQAVDKSGFINPDSVVYSSLLDTLTGDFVFNWIGLLSSSGELVMFSVSEPLNKTATATGVPGNVLSRSFVVQLQNIASLANVTIAAESWQIDNNAQFAAIESRLRQSVLNIVGESLFFGAGLSIYKAGTYFIKAGRGILKGYEVTLEDDIPLDGLGSNYVYIDAALIPSVHGSSIVITPYFSSYPTRPDYTAPNGTMHFRVRIGRVTGGVIEDLRENVTSENSLLDHMASIVDEKLNAQKAAIDNEQTIARNNLLNSINAAHDLLRAAEKDALDAEIASAHTALKSAITAERNTALSNQKATIDSEQTNARNALRSSVTNEISTAVDGAKTDITNSQTGFHNTLKSTITAERNTALNNQKATIDSEQTTARNALKSTITAERNTALSNQKATIDSEQTTARNALRNTIDSLHQSARNTLKSELEASIATKSKTKLTPLHVEHIAITDSAIQTKKYWGGPHELDYYDIIYIDYEVFGGGAGVLFSGSRLAQALVVSALEEGKVVAESTNYTPAGGTTISKAYLSITNITKTSGDIRIITGDCTVAFKGIYGVKF